MTDTTFTDPPNNPLMPLPGGASEALEFTCARELDFIAIDLAGAHVEHAYRDGAWQRGYEGSTYDAGARTGVLRRMGGWGLVPPKVSVQLKAAPPAPVTTFWESLYDVDFVAQPNQTLLAAAGSAAPTIAGKVWNVRCNTDSGAYPSSIALINGTGLRVTQGYDGRTFFSAGNPLCAYATLNLATQLPAWSPTRKTAVMLRVTSPALIGSSDAGDGVGAAAHVLGTPSSGRVFGRHWRGASAGSFVTAYGDSNTLVVDSSYSTAAGVDLVLALVQHPDKSAQGYWLPWSGTWPAMEDLIAGGYVHAANYAAGPGTSFGMFVCCQVGHAYAATLKRMQILQRTP